MPVRKKRKSVPQKSTANKEIEFKYSAEHMDSNTFISRCHKLTGQSAYYTEGLDTFYGNPSKPNAFCRYRKGEDINQFTYKEKIDVNNYVRIEHNIDLDSNMTVRNVNALCESLGFKYNTNIEKQAWIFKAETYAIVFYACYERSTSGLYQHLGKFIEIEMAEDYPWKNQKEAYSALCALEKRFKDLGISPKHRLKKSLWELFRK